MGKAGTARKSGPASNPGPAPEKQRLVLAGGAARALDRVIHERLRLGIVSALAVNESLTFNDLKKALGTSDGNLSVHARKLEDAGYVVCEKKFEGRVPRTEYRLSPKGRAALEGYVIHMEALIRATRSAQSHAAAK